MNWKKLFLVSLLACASVFGVKELVKACSDDLTEYSRVFFFLPENSNLAGTKYWLYQNKPGFAEEIELGEAPNLFLKDYEAVYQEWNVLLNTDYPLTDIKKAIFNSILTVNGIVPDTLEKDIDGARKVLEAISKQPDLQEFLLFAKQRENIVIGYSPDDYEYSAEELAGQKKAYMEAVHNMEAQLNTISGKPLLQSKYAFVYLKWALLGGDFKLANQMLEKLKQGPSRILEQWGRLYICELTEPGEQRNLMLADVLRNCPSKTRRCLDLFKPKENTAYIEAVEDSSLQAALWAMQTMHDYRPEKSFLEKILALDPNSLLLMDLINREINKYEDFRFTKALTGFDVFSGRSSSDAFSDSFESIKSILNKLISTPGLQAYNKEFYALSLAHVSLLANEPEKALSILETLKPEYKAHAIQKNITLLYHYSNGDLKNKNNLKKIVLIIQEISNQGGQNENVSRCISSVLLKSQQHFQKQGDWAKAGLCFLRSNTGLVTNHFFNDHSWLELNLTHEDFNNLENLLQNSSKTEFETLLAEGVNINNVYDSHARVYLRECNIEKTLSYLKKLPVWYRTKRYNYLIDTEIMFPGDRDSKVLDVISALEHLQEKLQKTEQLPGGEQKAREYYSMATAFFELSNKGTYPFTTAYYSTNNAPDSERSIVARLPKSLYTFYFKAEPAFNYFEKALAETKSPELKAEIIYTRLRAFDEVFESQHDYKKLPIGEWINYVQTFKGTEFYHLHPCPGVEEFAGL